MRTVLAIEDCGTESWLVRHIEARERLFAPTEVVVQAWSDQPADLDALIGRSASLEAWFEEEARFFHGVVVDVEERALRVDSFMIEIRFESRLALLKRGRDHRIFQEMTVEEIVTDVLMRSGIADLAEWQLSASYEPHLNAVQYGESDYDFITRLLFEEGIGYVIEQDESGERIVFFDDDSAYRAIEGDSNLMILGSAARGRHGLVRLTSAYRVTSDQVMMNDYDLEAPARDLKVSAEAEGAMAREVYFHPGGYADASRGQRLADRQLERLTMRRKTATGSSNVVRLATGRFFTVSDDGRTSGNGEYMLLEVTHHYSAGAGGVAEQNDLVYSNEFEAIPLSVPYRPQRAAPPPVIAGVQHALVTTPGGQQIHADEHGRVKVRFLWDRSGVTDDKSSTWLRVGQLALGGSMVLPRVDFEVLVDFEFGDLDRPVVSGHLYNAELPPSYALPGGNTVSSIQSATTEGGPGANELRFEDAAGSEEIFINASKDMTLAIDDSSRWNIGNDERCEIGSNHTLAVTSDYTSGVAGSRKVDIGGNQSIDVGANLSDGIGGDLVKTISGMRLVKSGGDHAENIAGSLTRTVGSLQSITGIAGVQRTIVGSSNTTVGAAWAELAGGARALNITGTYTESIGALKFIKAKNVAVNCAAAYTMNAAAELVKAGGGRADTAKGAVALTAGGVFAVKAKNIVFEAKNKLVFRGGAGVIELTKAGMVTIKAPKITVKNAKALKQIMHKSN